MLQNVEFLNWYVGILITGISLLGGFVVWKIKLEYEDFRQENTVQKQITNNTQDEIREIMKSLEVMREKMLSDLSYLKETVRHIPKLQEQVNRLELDIARTSEQIKYLTKTLENVERLGKIIKVKGQ